MCVDLSTQVEQACSSWLSDIAAICEKQGLQLLQHCTSAQGLLEAEHAVQEAIISWAPAPASDADTQQDTTTATDQARISRTSTLLPTGAAAAVAGSVPSKLGGIRGRTVTAWDVVCEQVLGNRVDLWQVSLIEP